MAAVSGTRRDGRKQSELYSFAKRLLHCCLRGCAHMPHLVCALSVLAAVICTNLYNHAAGAYGCGPDYYDAIHQFLVHLTVSFCYDPARSSIVHQAAGRCLAPQRRICDEARHQARSAFYFKTTQLHALKVRGCRLRSVKCNQSHVTRPGRSGAVPRSFDPRPFALPRCYTPFPSLTTSKVHIPSIVAFKHMS